MGSAARTVLLGFVLLGCSGAGEGAAETPEPMGEVTQALGTVEDAAAGVGCSTTAVWGLSTQIVAEMNCLSPNALVAVPDRPNFIKGSATFAYMQPPAASALSAALDADAGTNMNVQSMLRTVAQQYLLYRWYQLGSCGIQLAATPGNSNHESGLAIDVSEYATWQNALEAQGFKWYGSADLVHFDFVGAGTTDLSGQDVLAFQKLWNANNPADAISEDGSYGPETESRLKISPADGFATPPSCGSTNQAPIGSLDSADCDFVRGWAQDKDAPDQAIDVHVYFGGPAGDPNATEVTINAAENRADLCTAIGSCNHGFSLATPAALHDGNPHPVHAYAADTAGGADAELTGSPRTLSCAAGAAGAGGASSGGSTGAGGSGGHSATTGGSSGKGSQTPTESSGCGCRVPVAPTRGSAALLLFALAVGFRRRHGKLCC